MSVARFAIACALGAFTAILGRRQGRALRAVRARSTALPNAACDPAMAYSPTPIARPGVRASWLAKRDGESRGNGRYVEVSWDEALHLVHTELSRVRTEHGAEGILGGSYG